MNGWLTANTSEPFAELIAQQGAAQEYLWSRHEFVSESFENLYVVVVLVLVSFRAG